MNFAERHGKKLVMQSNPGTISIYEAWFNASDAASWIAINPHSILNEFDQWFEFEVERSEAWQPDGPVYHWSRKGFCDANRIH